MAEYELTVQVDSDGASGELKTLIEGNNQLIRNLRSSIGAMKQLASEVSSNAQKLDEITVNVSDALGEQTGRSTTIASSMEQLKTSVESISGNAEQASHAANGGNEEARKGRELIARTIESISELARPISQVVESMGALRKDTENITSILDVIRDVADQTNLLALNASIEAARAGDHGRRFAVVADEVRLLVQRTNDASINIQDLIEGLQKRSAQVPGIVDDGADRLAATIDESRSAGDAFENLAEAISQINQMNLTIANGLEQQIHITREVSENLSGINQLSEGNAEGARSGAVTSEELSHAADTLGKMVDQYKV